MGDSAFLRGLQADMQGELPGGYAHLLPSADLSPGVLQTPPATSLGGGSSLAGLQALRCGDSQGPAGESVLPYPFDGQRPTSPALLNMRELTEKATAGPAVAGLLVARTDSSCSIQFPQALPSDRIRTVSLDSRAINSLQRVRGCAAVGEELAALA